jgi:hypothetical protein
MENVVKDINLFTNRVIVAFRRSAPLRYGSLAAYLTIWFLVTQNPYSTVGVGVAMILGWLSAQKPPKLS